MKPLLPPSFWPRETVERGLETARRAIDDAIGGGIGIAHEAVRIAFPVALDAALELGDLEGADRLTEALASRPRGEIPPFLRGADLSRPRPARGCEGR